MRAAEERDLPALAAIYAHFVEYTSVTFDVEPLPVETWRERLATARAARRPWFVADEQDGAGVVGYATASGFRPKAAYASTVETTIYLAPGRGGRGTGRALYGTLLDACATAGFHRAVAGVTLPNPASAPCTSASASRRSACSRPSGASTARGMTSAGGSAGSTSAPAGCEHVRARRSARHAVPPARRASATAAARSSSRARSWGW